MLGVTPTIFATAACERRLHQGARAGRCDEREPRCAGLRRRRLNIPSATPSGEWACSRPWRGDPAHCGWTTSVEGRPLETSRTRRVNAACGPSSSLSRAERADPTHMTPITHHVRSSRRSGPVFGRWRASWRCHCGTALQTPHCGDLYVQTQGGHPVTERSAANMIHISRLEPASPSSPAFLARRRPRLSLRASAKRSFRSCAPPSC